jgi:all-trans-8'-apo-beta-carotenal 15,15'-oxygenase
MIESPSLALPLDPVRSPPRPDTAPAAPRSGVWRRCFDELPREHGFEPLRVEGAIPLDLHGRVYRNGPGSRAFDEPTAHWLDGDGVVTSVWFHRGKAAGAARVVETPGLAAERRAGRRLFSGLATPSAAPLREHLLGQRKNRANRSIFAWAGRVLALGGGAPVELSPDDLRPRGEADPEHIGTVRLGAQVRRVASRRCAYGFSAAAWGRRVDLIRYGEEGAVERIGRIDLPRPAAIHDIAVTARHLVFCVPPILASGWRASLGGGPRADDLHWDESLGTDIVIVPIDDPDRARTFTVQAFQPHFFCNAFEQGSEIVVDVCAGDDLDAVDGWQRALPAGGLAGVPLATSLRRIAVDLAGGRARGERLYPRSCALPTVAPCVRGEPHRFAYFVAHSSTRTAAGLPDRLVKLEVSTGRAMELELGPNQFPSEPVFIPRPRIGAREEAEDDGWISTEVYDARTHRSHAAIIDARTFEAPVGRAHFDHHLPYSLHGSWVPRDEEG